MKHDHGGYDCGYEVDYEIQMYGGGGFGDPSAAMPKEISGMQEADILNLLFPDPKIGFLPSWKQGFYFD